jgi:hypothetical protein
MPTWVEAAYYRSDRRSPRTGLYLIRSKWIRGCDMNGSPRRVEDYAKRITASRNDLDLLKKEATLHDAAAVAGR